MATFKQHTHTTNTLTEIVDGIEHTFELPHEALTDYNDVYVKISEDGRKAVVGYLVQDDDAQSPREDDNVGTMVCWHGRYNLGDEQPKEDAGDYLMRLASEADPSFDDKIERFDRNWNGADEYNEKIAALREKVLSKHYVILPLYLYDHSGISMSTGSFGDPWDSGQVGFIYVSRETILKEWGNGSKILTKKLKERAIKYLEGEVETYDDYLRGNVYGVCVSRFTREGTIHSGVCSFCGHDYSAGMWSEGGICLQEDCSSLEELAGAWEEVDTDACWGFIGEKWAEQELKDSMPHEDTWLNEPSVEVVPEEQSALFVEGV